MSRIGTASCLAAAALCGLYGLSGSFAPAATETPLQGFVRQMFDHIGAVAETCPEDVEAGPGLHAFCAGYPSSFSAFKLEWESTLGRYDLASLAHPRGAWSYTGGRYVRVYDVDDKQLTVRFDKKQRRIVLIHAEAPAPTPASTEPSAGPRGDAPRIAGFGGVTTPTVLAESRVDPVYPLTAREARMEGTVALEVLVLRDGSVGEVTLLRVSPPGWDLEQAAIEAVRQWRFEPAIAADEPVDAVLPVYLEFRLPE